MKTRPWNRKDYSTTEPNDDGSDYVRGPGEHSPGLDQQKIDDALLRNPGITLRALQVKTGLPEERFFEAVKGLINTEEYEGFHDSNGELYLQKDYDRPSTYSMFDLLKTIERGELPRFKDFEKVYNQVFGCENNYGRTAYLKKQPKQPKKAKSRIKNLLNQQFGRWPVVKYVGTNKSPQARWECRCDCSTVRVVVVSSLINGASKSCGCLRSGPKPKISDA